MLHNPSFVRRDNALCLSSSWWGFRYLPQDEDKHDEDKHKALSLRTHRLSLNICPCGRPGNLSCDEGDHDDQGEVDEHCDDEAPGDKDNPAAITGGSPHCGVCLGPAFRGDHAHSDT